MLGTYTSMNILKYWARKLKSLAWPAIFRIKRKFQKIQRKIVIDFVLVITCSLLLGGWDNGVHVENQKTHFHTSSNTIAEPL